MMGIFTRGIFDGISKNISSLSYVMVSSYVEIVFPVGNVLELQEENLMRTYLIAIYIAIYIHTEVKLLLIQKQCPL